MKKISIFLTIAVVMMVAGCSGCGTKTKSVTELLTKAWSAQTVKENSSVVYTKGATTNIRPGYSNFKLDLSSPSSVRYTEFENSVFTGTTWTVTEAATGNKLTLSGLSPKPTGTDGTIEFIINSASDTELSLTRTTSSQKTGGTINTYNLVSP